MSFNCINNIPKDGRISQLSDDIIPPGVPVSVLFIIRELVNYSRSFIISRSPPGRMMMDILSIYKFLFLKSCNEV
jgi:hypothetical protein